MKLKTLTEYSKLIEQSTQSPDLLADLLSELSQHYAFLTEQHIQMKLAKAKFEEIAKFKYTQDGELVERDKPLSDKAVENRWRLTPQGIEEYTTKRTLSSMEKLMSNLRSVLSQKKNELNNS